MRYLAPLLAVFLLFPAIASAQHDLRANCSNYSASLQPIYDSISRMDREIGLSSGNSRQRSNLYKHYDSMMLSYQKLENALLGHQTGSICTVDAKELRSSFDEIDDSLSTWYASLAGKNGLSKDEYRNFMKRSQSVQRDLEQLRRGFGPQLGGPNMPMPPHHGHPGMMPPPQAQQNFAMSQQTFDALKSSIRKESSDEGKLNVIRAAVANTNMTAAQEDEIIKMMTFESEKLSALKIMHPLVIDPENGFIVYANFNNGDMKEIQKIVDSNRAKYIYPMSDDTLAKAKQVIHKVVFNDAQVIVAQTVGSTFQMTCAQLIDLMKVMTSDEQKVELAATAYPNLSDRENWFTVYGALTFQSSKTTLESRVGVK